MPEGAGGNGGAVVVVSLPVSSWGRGGRGAGSGPLLGGGPLVYAASTDLIPELHKEPEPAKVLASRGP